MTSAQELIARARQRIREIAPNDARDRIEAGALALDVREPDEFAAGHVHGAVNIPRGLLEYKAPAHEALQDPASPVVVYCGSGGRAALAADTLQELGYTNVASIEGGYKSWTQGGNPTETLGQGLDEEG